MGGFGGRKESGNYVIIFSKFKNFLLRKVHEKGNVFAFYQLTLILAAKFIYPAAETLYLWN